MSIKSTPSYREFEDRVTEYLSYFQSYRHFKEEDIPTDMDAFSNDMIIIKARCIGILLLWNRKAKRDALEKAFESVYKYYYTLTFLTEEPLNPKYFTPHFFLYRLHYYGI